MTDFAMGSRRRRLTVVVTGALLGVSGCAAPVADSDDAVTSAAVEALSEPLCGLPGNERLAAHAVEFDDGIMDYEAWSAEPEFQAELPRLDETLRPFADRSLGPVLDHERQQIVVLVDAELLASGEVQRALQAAHLALPLRVQTACRPVAQLRAAEQTVLDLDWHPAARAVRFGLYWDVEHAQLVATFDRSEDTVPNGEAAAAPDGAAISNGALSAGGEGQTVVAPEPAVVTEVAHALEQRLGDIVRIQFGSVGRHSRTSDAQPHRGAAAVGDRFRNFCTSGFVVFRNGARSSVTAGHCFSNGASVFSGNGAIAYGLTAGKAAFPQFDMIRIESSGQTFQRQIWTDPGAVTTRTQTHKLDAGPNMLICTSGANVNTLAICNIRVAAGSCMICQNGCTTGLMRGTKTNVILSRNGDSGAPMYSADPSPPVGVTNGAVIHGMAVGSGDTRDVCWHRMSEVETRLGVTVALN